MHLKRLLLAVSFLISGVTFAAKNNSRSTIYMGSAMDNTFLGSNSPGWTATFVATDRALVQAYVGVSQTNPVFLMGAGVNFKYSVAGDATEGFHLGFGLGCGALTSGGGRTMFVNLAPVMGVHFHVTEHVMLNFDTGATVQILTEGTVVNFLLGGNSPLLGASVVFGL